MKSKPANPAPPPRPVESEDEEARYRPIEWALVRRLLEGLRPHWRAYAVGVGLGAVHVGMDLLSPQFIGAIVNYCASFTPSGRPPAGLAAWFWSPGVLESTPLAIRGLLLLVGAWGVTILLSVILQRLSLLVITRAGEGVQFDYRRRVFAHLQKLSMSYYDRTRLGRIISRCTSDISGMRDVNVWGMHHVVIHGAVIIVASLTMLWTDWRLFLAVAWLGPVLLWINRSFIRRSGKQWQVVREGFTRVSTNLAENITGMRVVTAYDRQDPNLAIFNQLQVRNTANNMKAAFINAVFQPSLELVRFIGRILILCLGGYLIATGRVGAVGVGGIVTVYFYWDWLMNSIVFLGNFHNQLMMALAGAERVFQLLDTRPEVQDVPGAIDLPRVRGDVEFQDVTFGYRPDTPVLHQINFFARAGSVIALVGATGSGKSSIISLIARFYQPQSGRVLVDGYDLRHVTGDSLHRQTGLVLQQNYLFTGTVIENIRYAVPHATDQQVFDAAEQLGTLDAIRALPHGFYSQVGERGANMSLGQRQLICFTRAYLADPRIFMLDEATSAVDTATELLIQQSLERLLRGRTTFIVAHRLSTIMKADQILVIDEGRIVERGTHLELLEKDGKYAHLYEQFVHHSE